MLDHTRRKSLLATAVAMNDQGLNRGTSGNLSCRLDNGFLITPSALAYERCTTADLVVVDMEGNVMSGSRKPSSEWRLHRDIYLNRPEAGAVLHAHPPWCTTLACLERDIPSYHYMVAIAGGDSIACAPYALFGSSDLSGNVLAALDGGRSACLLAHHGMVCFAGGLDGILALAAEVENLAQVYAQCLQVTEPPLLTKEEMEAVKKKFIDYKNPAR